MLNADWSVVVNSLLVEITWPLPANVADNSRSKLTSVLLADDWWTSTAITLLPFTRNSLLIGKLINLDSSVAEVEANVL